MSPTATIDGSLRQAAGLLQRCSDSPRLDAEVLLAKVLSRPRSALVAHADAPLDAAAAKQFRHLIDERRRGVPVAYLTGTREFWSLPLNVTPAVLVPRPETEDLVELVLERLRPDAPVRVLDLGTGSGAIALALASERPLASITAVDLSAAALGVAAAGSRERRVALRFVVRARGRRALRRHRRESPVCRRGRSRARGAEIRAGAGAVPG